MTECNELVAAYRAADSAAGRAAAIEAIGRAEPDSQGPATVLLATACGDDDETVATAAFGVIEGLGSPPIEYLDELIGLLASDHGGCVEAAARLIGRLGADGAPAAPRLVQILGDPDVVGPLRRRAAWALGRIGPACRQEAAAALNTATNDAEAAVARAAAAALRRLGE